MFDYDFLSRSISHVVDVVVDKKRARARDAGSVRLRKLLRSRGHVRLAKGKRSDTHMRIQMSGDASASDS